MKGIFLKITRVFVTVAVSLTICSGLAMNTVLAEGEAENESSENDGDNFNTSISITPVSKLLQLSPDKVYEDVLKVANNGNSTIRFEVYAAPYSYVQSEEDSLYTLGFTHENSYTQITRWITIQDKNGNYVKNPIYTAEAGETVEIPYKITTPSSLPNGGQYAVIFAHTLSGTTNANGIKTEASPGLVIYSRAEGDTVTTAEIIENKLSQSIEKEEPFEEGDQTKVKKVTLNRINASAKVRNTGNIDFNAKGTLKVEGILGGAYYETPANEARVSVIPESELVVSDIWEETPDFGFFKATWTVTAAGETQTMEAVYFLIPPAVIIITIILLTIIIIWIIIMVRKRKEHRARFAV